MKQIIIAVGREFGSGGHVIAKGLAEYYNIPLYNQELLNEIARESYYSKEVLERFDERPINISFIPIPVAGNTMSIEQEIAIKQFNFLRRKANEEKESFVVVGRCADEVLVENPNLVRVFITGDKESKIKRVMEREGIDAKQAENKMKKVDKMRKTYHNFYCESKWGDSRGYDICINTAKIDFETAQKMIELYVEANHR
jgi:cytidylate kinase